MLDLIVLGTHGRTGLAHVLMGSVAERVVRNALSGADRAASRPQVQASARQRPEEQPREGRQVPDKGAT